jgi:hypothetical protein
LRGLGSRNGCFRQLIAGREAGSHELLLVTLSVLQNSNQRDSENSSSHEPPTKHGPTEPSYSLRSARFAGSDGLSGRQVKRDHIAAIAAAGKVLHHMVSLAAGESLLGKRGQQIGIGMRLRRQRLWPLQPGSHDFGHILHFSSLFVLSSWLSAL